MSLQKSTSKNLFHPSESESRARMVHWVCGWFVVPEFRNESSQIIYEWKVSSTSFVHGYFVPEIPYNFCGSSTFQYCASRPLSSPLANFCIFGGPCSSARDDWSCCEVECIFVYKNIKETRMFFFFLKMCGYHVCVLTSLSLVKQSFPFFDICFSQDVDFHTCYLEIQGCFPCFSDKILHQIPLFHRYPFSFNQWLQPPSPTGWAHRGWRCFAFARAEVPQRRCDAKPPCQGHGWRCCWLGPGSSQEPGLVVFFLCRVLEHFKHFWILISEEKTHAFLMNTWVVKFCPSVLLINFGWSGAWRSAWIILTVNCLILRNACFHERLRNFWEHLRNCSHLECWFYSFLTRFPMLSFFLPFDTCGKISVRTEHIRQGEMKLDTNFVHAGLPKVVRTRYHVTLRKVFVLNTKSPTNLGKRSEGSPISLYLQLPLDQNLSQIAFCKLWTVHA